MGAKFRLSSESKNIFEVSPASYNTQTHFYNRGISFTKSKQRPETSKEYSRAPGPNKYVAMTDKKVCRGGSFAKAKKINKLTIESQIGPGSYELRS